MKNEMIFAFFLQISNHMWLDGAYPHKPYWAQDEWDENNNCDIDTWDRVVDFIAERKYNMLVVDVGDGVKLDSHPEIAAPDAWSKEFLRKKLDELRAKGIEPIPKMNFSCCHNVWQKEWRYKIGLSQYMDFARDIITEVCELFGNPRFFHLGLDEETYEHQAKYGIAIVRNEPVFWKDAYALFDICEKNGARPWVFSDYFIHHPEIFEKRMPKSVIQSNWYYGAFNPDPKYANACWITPYRRFEELGYDQIPTFSTWSVDKNPIQGVRYCKEVISPEHLLGFNEIPWHNTTASAYYTLISDAERLYQGRQIYFPETL